MESKPDSLPTMTTMTTTMTTMTTTTAMPLHCHPAIVPHEEQRGAMRCQSRKSYYVYTEYINGCTTDAAVVVAFVVAVVVVANVAVIN